MENGAGGAGKQGEAVRGSRGNDSTGEVNQRFDVRVGDIMGMAEEPRGKGRKRRKVGPLHGDVRDRRETKKRGEIGEAMFMTKAMTMGYNVAKLWGDSDRYDLIVDTGEKLLRVQVKSAQRVSANGGGGFHFKAHGRNRKSYRASEIDLLVACVLPLDAWYVFPPHAFKRMKSMRLFPQPGKKISKFEKYRDAWELFQEGRRAGFWGPWVS